MTYHEAAVITVYTGINMFEGEDLKYMYDYASDLLGRPVHTLDFLLSDLKEKSRPDFIKICKNLTRRNYGEWIVQDGRVICSECGEPNLETNYCPSCGADMRGK